ncbi:MAG: HAMP domain-containing histidine kinase, partial [Flavobacterium sp.]
KSNLTRWVIIMASFLIVVLILWNTYNFFQIFKNEERAKVETWVEAYKAIGSAPLDCDLGFQSKVLQNNTTIPLILTDSKGAILTMNNIDEEIQNDPVKKKEYFEDFKKQNPPIITEYLPGEFQYVYYGNSSLLNQLKYFPIALVLIIILFAMVVYNFYGATKMATQNKLWAGMAKETAHQIGTPLSSLIGWLEIMKADNVDETTVTEIEKDINRLLTITDRFSKIGSEPVLEKRDIVDETLKTFEYLKSRSSRQVEFVFKAPDHAVPVMLNPELHSWTVENLVKNAIDAMKGKGRLEVTIGEKDKFVRINVNDTGKGIPKSQFTKVFEPGFTTKKRGWGLGLSLTRRIVEEYHKGRIKVLASEVGKGTTMQASYRKA